MSLESSFLSSLKRSSHSPAHFSSIVQAGGSLNLISVQLVWGSDELAAWIEGKNSLGARELSNPTDAQSEMSNLSKCTVIK